MAVDRFRRLISGSLLFAFHVHTWRGFPRLFRIRSPPEVLPPRSARWFGIWPCSPTPGGRPPSPVQHSCYLSDCSIQTSWEMKRLSWRTD